MAGAPSSCAQRRKRTVSCGFTTLSSRSSSPNLRVANVLLMCCQCVATVVSRHCQAGQDRQRGPKLANEEEDRDMRRRIDVQ
jgi:hypothetical protein